VAMPELEPDSTLPPMLLGEQVVEDYRRLHLSLKAHPVAFLRADLTRRGILRHAELPTIASGRRVTVGGLVLVRQRPGTASGVIFMTLEDETAIANTIVWPKIYETFRPIVLGARLVSVTGKLQNESGVIHVVAERIDDLTSLLAHLSQANDTACVEGLARADVKYSNGAPDHHPHRHLRAGDALVTLFRDQPELAGELGFTADVMPKGRNFH
jgi:error-prone DNA polymerase